MRACVGVGVGVGWGGMGVREKFRERHCFHPHCSWRAFFLNGSGKLKGAARCTIYYSDQCHRKANFQVLTECYDKSIARPGNFLDNPSRGQRSYLAILINKAQNILALRMIFVMP